MSDQVIQQKAEENVFLCLKHLEKIYPNGEKAVHDFSLDISKEEFIVIVGPSGCGKSTMLRMIAGLEDITSGDIYLEGELLNYKPSKDRKMAIVFQSYALYPQMNVFDNIAFPLTINKYPMPVRCGELFFWGEIQRKLAQDADAVCKALREEAESRKSKRARAEKFALRCGISAEAANLLLELYRECGGTETGADWKEKIAEKVEAGKRELAEKGAAADEEYYLVDENGKHLIENRKLTAFEIKQRVFETAEKLDLVPYLDKLPRELSGGQMQRVALGRAIIKNVPIFMMDEPLSNLDAKLRLTMRSDIVKLHHKIGATTIYVTHDQTEAMTMATRIVVMSRGFIQQIGTPKEIYNDPANIFVAQFIGSPSMNVFEAQYEKDGIINLGGMKICGGEKLRQIHDEFYKNATKEFEAMLENFDGAAQEKLLQILSCTGESKKFGKVGVKKEKVLKKLFSLFKKQPAENVADKQAEIVREKCGQLARYTNSDHKVLLGIRPERVLIEKCEEGKDYTGRSVVMPTVCELLGGEYNIHFDFCGQDVVANFDAKQTISVNDRIAVSFLPEDIFLFDPVTGKRFF